MFIPIAAETIGAINKNGMDFLCDVERRIVYKAQMITARGPSSFSDSPFRFNTTIRYNAVAVLGTFTHTTHEDEM